KPIQLSVAQYRDIQLSTAISSGLHCHFERSSILRITIVMSSTAGSSASPLSFGAQFPIVISSAAGSSAIADDPAESRNLLFRRQPRQRGGMHYIPQS